MLILRARKVLLGVVAGASMALVMPGLPFGFAAFVALIPFLLVLEHGRGFLAYYVSGFVFFAINLRWLFTLSRFDSLAIPGVLVLFAYLAISFGLLGIALRVIRKRLRSDLSLLVAFPVFYTLFEILRNVGPLALGFSSLYQSLYRYPALIQLAAYLGPWSITAAIAFVNVSLYLAIKRRRALYAALAGGGISLLLLLSLLPVNNSGEQIKAAIVSSEVNQKDKLDDRNLLSLLDRYGALGQSAAAYSPELIVFPESILPGYILRDDRLLPQFTLLASSAGAEILLGTGDYVHGKIYNSIAGITSQGDIEGTYDMVHPVPFGEFIPGRDLLQWIGLGSFIDSFLPQEVTPGDEYTPLLGVGTPICFESTFPTASRVFARNGASLLAVLTNDAWFAGSSEIPAHFACAVYRAVETRRYVLQSANCGISGVIDERGRIVASSEQEGIVAASVVRLSGESLYVRYGDIPLYVLFAVVSLFAVLAEVRKKRGRD